MKKRTLELRGTVRSFSRAEGSPVVEAVISTDVLGRDGAIIEASGWDLEAYRRNPVVLWAHDDRGRLPVARAIDVSVQDDRLVAVAEFDEDDPEAMRLYRKIERGFVNAVSVRWNPLEWEHRNIDGRDVLVFTRQELLEFSFVSVPADPEALIVRSDGRRFDPADFGAPVMTERTGLPDMARLDALERRISALAERRRDALIRAIAAATGRSESHIRTLLEVRNV